MSSLRARAAGRDRCLRRFPSSGDLVVLIALDVVQDEHGAGPVRELRDSVLEVDASGTEWEMGDGKWEIGVVPSLGPFPTAPRVPADSQFSRSDSFISLLRRRFSERTLLSTRFTVTRWIQLENAASPRHESSRSTRERTRPA